MLRVLRERWERRNKESIFSIHVHVSYSHMPLLLKVSKKVLQQWCPRGGQPEGTVRQPLHCSSHRLQRARANAYFGPVATDFPLLPFSQIKNKQTKTKLHMSTASHFEAYLSSRQIRNNCVSFSVPCKCKLSREDKEEIQL